MYRTLHDIASKPKPFEHYTAADLWTDEHISAQMLRYHLDGSVDISSRRTEFINRSAAWIASRFHLDTGASVADFGCGPGLYASRFAAAGADVTGIDFSERSIAYAREAAAERALDIDYVHTNYLGYESEKRFDLITMIMCDFCALGPDQRRAMLEKFHHLLEPGGAVVLDVYSMAAFDARNEAVQFAPNLMDGFWSPRPYFGFVHTFTYDAERVVLDKYTIVEENRTRTIYNWLQYFIPEALTTEFDACGLKVEDCFGSVAGDPYDAQSDEFAVVARKPE